MKVFPRSAFAEILWQAQRSCGLHHRPTRKAVRVPRQQMGLLARIGEQRGGITLARVAQTAELSR